MMIITTQIEKKTAPAVGDQVGECVLESMIRNGSSSMVFKARHLMLDMPRIIKVMKPMSYAGISQNVIDRFFIEARLMASIKHPNIVSCFNFGLFQNRLPYMELEYIDGVDVFYWLKFIERIPNTVTLSIISSVCDALLELHTCEYTLYGKDRRGVVHRNLMPENIMVSREGIVKLIDFGLAKADGLSLQTFQHGPVGDYSYISPEQMKNEKVDTKADIYSLGCILFEMLAGKKAFGQKNWVDLLDHKCREKFDRDALERVPDQLVKIVNRCLKRSPFDRFSSMYELKCEIDQLLNQYDIQNPRQVIRDFRQNYLSYDEPELIKNKSTEKPLFLISLVMNGVFIMALGFILFKLYALGAMDLIRGY
jgi:serine/threonine-protein kinase